MRKKKIRERIKVIKILVIIIFLIQNVYIFCNLINSKIFNNNNLRQKLDNQKNSIDENEQQKTETIVENSEFNTE